MRERKKESKRERERQRTTNFWRPKPKMLWPKFLRFPILAKNIHSFDLSTRKIFTSSKLLLHQLFHRWHEWDLYFSESSKPMPTIVAHSVLITYHLISYFRSLFFAGFEPTPFTYKVTSLFVGPWRLRLQPKI